MAIGTLFGGSAESIGLYGNSAGNSVNPTVVNQTYFEWFIFTTSSGTPATPTGGSWDFTSNTGTAPSGWSSFISGVPLNSLWFSVAFIDSRNPTATIAWSTPGLISSQSVYATAYADVFTGNGSTTAWTLSQDPVVVNNTDVSINGVTQIPGTDYTLSSTTLTTTTAAPLNAKILVKYRQALPLSYYGAASNVQFTPVGTLTSTNVQSAIAEVLTDYALQTGAASIGFTPVGAIAATNVQSAIAEVVTDLALSSGSSTVGYIQTGTGATATTVQAKLRQTVSVKDFGAVGDGTTDDTAAIKNAINSGYAVYFPKGNYFVTAVVGNTVFSLKQGQHLFGDGINATSIIVNPTNPSGLAQSIFTITQNDCNISEMSINGGGITSMQNIIHVYTAYRATFNNLYIYNVNVNYGTFRIEDSFYCTVTNLQIDAYATSNPTTGTSHGLFIINSVKQATYHRCNNITVNGGNFGIAIWYQQNCVFDNLILTTPVNHTAYPAEGINFTNSSFCSITNATIYGRRDAGFVMSTDNPSNGVCENNVISNITSNFNTLDGIYVDSGRNNQFNNIICLNNNQGTPTYGNRYGIFVNTAAHTTTLENSFSNIIASDTQSTPTQSSGVYVDLAQQTRFFNVVAHGNVNSSYGDYGISTSISIMDYTGYRNLFNYGISTLNGSNVNSGYFAQNNAGTDIRILALNTDSYLSDGTSVVSAGGGIRFVKSDGTTVLGYVTDAGQWYLNFSGTLKPVTYGATNTGGTGYRQLIVPN